MSFAIDAHVLIWAIKKEATANRQDMIVRADDFLRQCRTERREVFIPAHALAEFLAGYDDAQVHRTIISLSRSFVIAPFDAKAAIIAAKIQRDWNKIKQIANESGVDRCQIKADICIVASAVASGASTLYSHDRQMVSLAQGHGITVKELPPPRTQTSAQKNFLPPEDSG
jgi:predicted nucleic acid-binding protein